MLDGAQQAGKAVTAVSLAEYFGADPTTLSRSLKPLIKRGLIAGRPDPGDGRSRLASPQRARQSCVRPVRIGARRECE